MMTDEEIKQIIIEEHIEDITEWVFRDLGSLDIWLTDILKLNEKSREELLNEYPHIQEDLEGF